MYSVQDFELLLDFVSRQLSFADLSFVFTYLGEPQLAETAYIDGNPSETYFKIFHVWRCKYPRIDHKAKLKEVFSSMERQDLIERMEMFSKDIYCYKEALDNPTERAQSSDFIIMSQNLASRSQHVLRFLGLKQSDIDQIKTDARTTQETILRALSKIQKDRPSLTRQSICNALYYADHSDVIDMLNSSWNRAGLPLEDFKCRKHPNRPLSQFCIPCDVTLCQECIRTSSDHKKHDVRDVEKLFRKIHKRKDGDAVLICLLLCPSYKINLKEEHWIKKYNAVAEVFKFKKIKKPSNLSSLKKYKPILRQDSVNVEFSCEFFRDTSFLRFAKDQKFVNMFLDWAEKENIANYCRSSNYLRKETEEEVCCWLLPNQTEQLIEKLGEDMFTHATMRDESIHELVYNKLGIPVQVIMRGGESVRNFMHNLKKGETTMYHASGMIIGCAGSGKSTLLERLKGIDLNEILKNSTSTRGIDLQFNIFDVADTTVRVNTSNQKQCFQIKIDESGKQKIISNQPAKLSGDMKKLDIKESGDQMDAASIANEQESVSDEEITHESFATESESRKGNEAAAFVEKEKEIVKDSRKNVPEKSEISGILRVSKDVLDYPEKKITMVDFAGLCSYYASHQIFLSPKAFFILVLNMEKKLDEKVGKEVCSQGGSIYEGWTHRDYLTFWAKSIHQYSSEKAPVILVGTHAESKTKEEKEKFFREIWTSLETKDASLQRHFDSERMFAIGFHENECIEKIKLSVVDVVKNLDHWGEKLTHSWAMFEKFFQEKKNLKIINKETLLAFNEALPQEMKLQTVEDIHTMLQFFHDIREILHFNQESLKGIIILDVQWFADAFKNVLTDKNHAAEDLFMLASQWDRFNESGELSDTLLSAIWEMNNNGYLEHKDDIMRYMEKLGLLARMDDKTWYVPCMNKRPFPVHRFSEYPASSILCFLFDALPVGIFQRLVARCMEFPWALLKEIKDRKERPLIYQTAAVFLFEKDHNILLGMTPTEIQLQVFVSEGDVDISTCFQIKEKIEGELYILSSTFQRNLKFHTAFKCKPEGFCDNNSSAVIYESDLIGTTFQCPSCPEEEKHIVCTKDITKYWIEVRQVEKEDEGDIYDSSIEMILNAVSRKLVNITSRILEAYFGVMEQPPTMCVEEDRFRILYKWKCANSSVDHKKELERILREAEQEEAADCVGTFQVSDFVCSDLMEPNRYVSNKECRMLSEKLSKEYTHLVRFLGLPHVRIEQLEADVRTIRERIYECLLKVREECPNLSRRDLCRALNFVKRSDVIDNLKKQWK